MPSPVAPSLPIDRAALAQVFKDPRTLFAIEQALQLALQISPNQIAALQALLDAAQMVITVADPDFPAARVLTAGTGITIDTATAGLIKVEIGFTPAAATDDFVTFDAPPADLPNARQLSGGTGVTVDIATAGLAKVVVNVLTILNAAAINLTQPVVSSAALQAASVDAVGLLECGSFKINDVATATATASDHSVPIQIGGTVYYMRLSTVP